jgi:hypothetical protein
MFLRNLRNFLVLIAAVLMLANHYCSAAKSCTTSPARAKPKIAVVCAAVPLIWALLLHHS